MEAQEELAFIYEAHKNKNQSNSRFLEYVKNYETKANLTALRKKLNIDYSIETRPREDLKRPQNQENTEEGQKSDPFSFKAFKEILKGVLKENS